MKLGSSILIFFFCCGIGLNAFAEPFTGFLYEQGSNKQKLLFNLKRTEEKNEHQLLVKIVYTDPLGVEAVVENLVMQNGKVFKYFIHHKQMNEESALEVQGDKIIFKKIKGNKTEIKEETRTENFVVGPSLLGYLSHHWESLLKGDTISVRYAALDRQETIGFKIFRTHREQRAGREVLIIKMKPSSFIIAVLVKPLVFIFDVSTKVLIELQGRTLPKIKSNKDWKDLDVDGIYQF
jgi:hypothetical protein